jgi:hypothetical protein
MFEHGPNFVAGGNIKPSRIVVLDNTADNNPAVGSFTVLAALAADAVNDLYAGRSIVGVSMPGTDYPPLNDSHVTVGGYAAILGEGLQVATLGEYCLVELGATVLTGQRLKPEGSSSSDANAGRAVPVVTQTHSAAGCQYTVGIALQSGVAGDKILMLVHPEAY